MVLFTLNEKGYSLCGWHGKLTFTKIQVKSYFYVNE